MQYKNLSRYYDMLSDDQPYDKWLEIIHQHSKEHSAKSILDLACGTGTLTQQLPAYFDTVYGIDLSSDMIDIAKTKSEAVSWYVRDMSDFQLDQLFDMITLLCDGLNYLADPTDVMATFNHVYHHLNQGGVFIFDVHTTHKVMTQFDNQVYLDDREDLTLVWQTELGELPYSVWHDLTFFIRSNDHKHYQRIDETHFQMTLPKEQYIEMLKSIGFHDIQTFYDFDVNNQQAESDRLFFIVKK